MDQVTFDDLYVRRLKERDRETWEHFVQYFSPRLVAQLYGNLPAQDIDDAKQDVVMRTLLKLDDLRESCKLPSFVWGICRNILLERYHVRPTEPLEDWLELIIDDWNFEEELLRKENVAIVRQILSEMGDSRDAKILRAIFLDDEDRAEVARRFNLSDENFRVVLHRAKQKFKEALRRNSKRWGKKSENVAQGLKGDKGDKGAQGTRE